jgi:uroporphyrinogen decarboxylase
MVERINRERPGVPVIGFAKGAGALLETYREETGVDCVGLDWTVPAGLARRIQKGGAVQGNLDPLRVIAGGAALDQGVDLVIETLGDGPLIFNLGHGITPQADPENVTRLVNRIRGAEKTLSYGHSNQCRRRQRVPAARPLSRLRRWLRWRCFSEFG